MAALRKQATHTSDASSSKPRGRIDIGPPWAPRFGNAKPGLGLVLTLGARSTVKGVEIDSADGGWNAEVYVSDTNNGDFSDWQQHGRAGRISEASNHATITLGRSASGQYVLVWFTKLPSSGKLTVNEVKLA